MMKINKDKRIGSVIFVVEGKKTEPRIIRDIFLKVLGYSVYQYNKQEDIIMLKANNDEYNKVVIITNNKPQLSCVLNTANDFLDNAFKRLNECNLDAYNSAIYYIFDRDYESNSNKTITKLINTLSNSRDNDYNPNGLLLISYPCIEAFYLNANNDNHSFKNGKEIKKYVNEEKYKTIKETSIINAYKALINILKEKFSVDSLIDNLDDFKNVGKQILNNEDKYYQSNNKFITLSLLAVAFLDLGIIEDENNNIN